MPGFYTRGQSHGNFEKEILDGIQGDESTDISKESVLIAYITYFFLMAKYVLTS